MAAIRAAEGSTHAEASLGEIQSVADGAAHCVERHPAHIFLANATLEHKVFHQASYRIVREGGYDGGIHPKASPEAAGDVVFAASFPGAKMARRGDALVPRVETQHDL